MPILIGDNCLWEHKKNKVKFAELPKYPEVRRDLALVLDKDIKFSAY
jgi:phenylalanyl-tRNA synthetase beta chain